MKDIELMLQALCILTPLVCPSIKISHNLSAYNQWQHKIKEQLDLNIRLL